MKISYLNTNILTHAAIEALKNAYVECSDKAAKESIVTASRAIIRLQRDLVKYIQPDKPFENADSFDPSDYCAAV